MVDQLFNREGAIVSASGPGDDPLRLDDVYLQGATPEGQAVVGNLSMILDESGLTVLGPNPGTRRVVSWDRMSGLEIGPPATMPTGELVATLQFLLDGRPLRFLVPAAQGAEAGLLAPTEPAADRVSEPVVVPDAGYADGVVPGDAASYLTESVGASTSIPESTSMPESVETTAAVAEALQESTSIEQRVSIEQSVETTAAVVESPETAGEAAIPAAQGPEFVDVVPEQTVGSEAPGLTAEPAAGDPVEEEPLTDVPAAWDPVATASSSDVPAAHVDASSHVASASDDDVLPIPGGDVAALSSAFVDDSREAELLDDLPAPSPLTAGPIEAPAPAPTARRSRPPRHRRPQATKSPRPGRWYRLVMITLLVALIPIAGGAWYLHERDSATTETTQSGVSAATIASSVGIQRGDVSGWKSDNSHASNAFAAGATTHGHGAAQTAQTAAGTLARCLRVPVSAVDGAFGLSSTSVAPVARVGSPDYLDPDGNGGAVSSVVDVMSSDSVAASDVRVFQNPALFATCYQPYLQAMLPYAGRTGAGTGGFATAVVEPVAVPTPPQGAKVQVVAFQIARIGNDPNETVTEITTAIAIFGGRTQATVDAVSDFVFPIDVENQVVQSVEARLLGVSAL